MSESTFGAQIRIELGDDRLPSGVVLEPLWRRTSDARGLGDDLLDAYRIALWRKDRTSPEAVNWDSLPTAPTRRQQALALLGAETMRRHHEIVNSVQDPQAYSFGGATTDVAGRPAVFVVADWSLVTAVVVDPQWAAAASDDDVATEFLHCIDRIRTRRQLVSAAADRPELSDEQLIEQYRSHVLTLAVAESVDNRW